MLAPVLIYLFTLMTMNESKENFLFSIFMNIGFFPMHISAARLLLGNTRTYFDP